MDSQKDGQFSRFQLLLGLTGLAFVTITAGTGLMQAYFSARGIIATNGTGLPHDEYSMIARQSNILFTLGQLLLVVGLAIIFSIFLQSIFYLKPWVKQAGRRMTIALIVGIVVGVLLPS